MKTTMTIRIEEPVKKRLQKLADKDKRSLSDYCAIILEDKSKKVRK